MPVQRRAGKVSNLVYPRFAIMDSESKSNCHTCPMHSSCEPADRADGGEKLSGWPLVGQATAYFLLPLVAAIAAVAIVKGEEMRILAGVGAFVISAAAAAVVGVWVRRRRKVTQ